MDNNMYKDYVRGLIKENTELQFVFVDIIIKIMEFKKLDNAQDYNKIINEIFEILDKANKNVNIKRTGVNIYIKKVDVDVNEKEVDVNGKEEKPIFSSNLKQVMIDAGEMAKEFNHEFIGSEHLLLALIDGEGKGYDGYEVLKNMGLNFSEVKECILNCTEKGPDPIDNLFFKLTPRSDKIIKYSVDFAKKNNHIIVGTEHLVYGLLEEYGGVPFHILRERGITLEKYEKKLNQICKKDVSNA